MATSQAATVLPSNDPDYPGKTVFFMQCACRKINPDGSVSIVWDWTQSNPAQKWCDRTMLMEVKTVNGQQTLTALPKHRCMGGCSGTKKCEDDAVVSGQQRLTNCNCK